MPAYHYHPDDVIYIRHASGDYSAKVAEFTADYGGAPVVPVDPYNEIYYDLIDEAQRENRNNVTPLNDAIETADPAIEAIINDYANLMVAKDLRENPPLTLEQKKFAKVIDLKTEGLIRMQAELSGISDFDTVELLREMWLSITPASRSATVTFQKIIDIYQAGKAEVSVINGYATEAEVDAYDVVTTPAWPV